MENRKRLFFLPVNDKSGETKKGYSYIGYIIEKTDYKNSQVTEWQLPQECG